MSATTPVAQRRAEEKARRRASILDAAESVVLEKGFDALTLGDVASLARLSRSLVYVYFDGKEDLGYALAHRGSQELTRRFEHAAAAHTDGAAQIFAIGRAYVRFAKEEPARFEMMAHAQSREADVDDVGASEGALLRSDMAALHLMADVIRRGHKDGSIRSALDPLKTSIALWSFLHGVIQVWSMKGTMLGDRFGFDEDALLDHAFDMISVSLAGE